MFIKLTICCFLFSTSFNFNSSKGILLKLFKFSMGKSVVSFKTRILLPKVGSICVLRATNFSSLVSSAKSMG